MNPPADDDRTLISDARNALQRRDGAAALSYLNQLASMNMPWLMLAQACNLLGDTYGEEVALQRQLEQEPRNLPALLLTGELKAREGDDRAAISFFQAAVNAAAISADVPSQLHAMLTRAENFIQQVGLRFQEHLLDQLTERGISKNGRVGAAVIYCSVKNNYICNSHRAFISLACRKGSFTSAMNFRGWKNSKPQYLTYRMSCVPCLPIRRIFILMFKQVLIGLAPQTHLLAIRAGVHFTNGAMVQ